MKDNMRKKTRGGKECRVGDGGGGGGDKKHLKQENEKEKNSAREMRRRGMMNLLPPFSPGEIIGEAKRKGTESIQQNGIIKKKKEENPKR